MANSQDITNMEQARSDSQQIQSLEVEKTSNKDSQNLEEVSLISETEGNCTVIFAEEIAQKLPKTSLPYISISCRNYVDEDSMLSQWKGFFPTSLVKAGDVNLVAGTKFQLDVQERFIPDEDDSVEPFEHIFNSEQFLKSSLIGRWGNTPVEGTEEDERVINVVDLSKSGITDNNFYIFPEY